MYCHNWEEYLVNKGKNDDDFQIILLQNYEEKHVMQKSSTTKQTTETQIIEKKTI